MSQAGGEGNPAKQEQASKKTVGLCGRGRRPVDNLSGIGSLKSGRKELRGLEEQGRQGRRSDLKKGRRNPGHRKVEPFGQQRQASDVACK